MDEEEEEEVAAPAAAADEEEGFVMELLRELDFEEEERRTIGEERGGVDTPLDEAAAGTTAGDAIGTAASATLLFFHAAA